MVGTSLRWLVPRWLFHQIVTPFLLENNKQKGNSPECSNGAVVRWFKHFSSWHKLKNYGKRQEVLTSHNLLPKLKFSTCISCLFLFKAASLLGTPTVAISPKKSNTCRNPSIKPQNTNTKSRVAKVFQQKKTFNIFQPFQDASKGNSAAPMRLRHRSRRR